MLGYGDGTRRPGKELELVQVRATGVQPAVDPALRAQIEGALETAKKPRWKGWFPRSVGTLPISGVARMSATGDLRSSRRSVRLVPRLQSAARADSARYCKGLTGPGY